LQKGISETERFGQGEQAFFDVYPKNRDIEKSQSPSNALKTPFLDSPKWTKSSLVEIP